MNNFTLTIKLNITFFKHETNIYHIHFFLLYFTFVKPVEIIPLISSPFILFLFLFPPYFCPNLKKKKEKFYFFQRCVDSTYSPIFNISKVVDIQIPECLKTIIKLLMKNHN